MKNKISLLAHTLLFVGLCTATPAGFDPATHVNPTWNVIQPGQIKDSFASVEGNINAKEELRDIINFLINPELYEAIGAIMPKGVLLEGPPGTGKTLLARAVAGEANCPFISVSGSQFTEMFVGVGAARIRSLFEAAHALECPCIIFIDEIDALIKKRLNGALSQDADLTLNEFLKQMDGFEQYKHPIIVIGATNRLDTADPAALRPGRFDRIVHVSLPTLIERENILALHARKRKCSPDIDLKTIAASTPGLSGAFLANLINEAAIMAVNKGKTVIEQVELEEALDKTLMGKPNKSLIFTPEEKRKTAFHESGHALVHVLLKGNEGLHKVSCISRGDAGGVTSFLDQEKKYLTKQDFINRIMIGFGGMAAEEIIFDVITTGPQNDLQQVTGNARAMVCKYGMSPIIGRVAYQYEPEVSIAPYAQSTLTAIDAEVRTILEECYENTVKLLKKNKKALDAIAQALLEKEEISAEEVYEIVRQTT